MLQPTKGRRSEKKDTQYQNCLTVSRCVHDKGSMRSISVPDNKRLVKTYLS